MIEPKNITIEDMEFQVTPMGGLEASRLDKRILTLIIPALGGLNNLDLDSEIDFSVIFTGLTKGLEALSDKEFENLICSLLSKVVYLPENQAPISLSSKSSIDAVFQMKLLILYKLLFEVMKYNKFTPFEVAEGGSLTSAIHTSAVQKQADKKHGSKSEKSGNLIPE